MSDGTVSQGESQPPPARPWPTDKENPSLDFPITAEDLAKLGVEPRLIPFVVSTALRAEQSPNGPPPLSQTEAEDLVEILDKVRLHSQIFIPPAKSPTTRFCHPPW